VTAAEDRLRRGSSKFGSARTVTSPSQRWCFSQNVYQNCFRDSHEYRPCGVEDNGVLVTSTAMFSAALLKKRCVGNVASYSYYVRETSSVQSWC
jgi:hypothetical protein